MDIDHNPFHCDARMIWTCNCQEANDTDDMRRYCGNHEFFTINPGDSMMCNTPAEMNGTSIFGLGKSVATMHRYSFKGKVNPERFSVVRDVGWDGKM